MKLASLDHFGLSAWRLGCVGVAAGSASWMAADLGLGTVLGGAKPEALFVLGGVVFYVVVTIPRRLLERQRASQAREAVALSATAKACLKVTDSRARTLAMVKPKDPEISKALKEAARLVLLGTNVEAALVSCSAGLASYTAAATLKSIGQLSPEGFEAGDEESQGLEASSGLLRETRLPMLMTVCFFAPIMTVLYAVFAHDYGALSVSELVAFEFIVVDLAFYLSSGEGVRT